MIGIYSVQVLASPTENMGTLLNAVHSVHIGGELKLSNAIQVAQLALKHRRTKTGAFSIPLSYTNAQHTRLILYIFVFIHGHLYDAGGQRVVVFVGSPITEDEKTLVKIGKLLKKNNVRL